MKVVEVVVGRSVTFHQGTCLSCLSTLPSGVVLFHHDEGVNCLCVSDLMCYVLILMLVNLLSLPGVLVSGGLIALPSMRGRL